MLQQKSNYRTFEANGRTVLIDDFIYRRLFKDPDIPPRRKYTFIYGINISDGYLSMVLKEGKKYIRLSRYIMHAGKGEFVDHINRNCLDNRRCNLRIVTARQNNLNRKLKNGTGLICVSRYKYRNRFIIRTQFTTKEGKKLGFYCHDTPFNRVLTALAHDKFVLQAGEEEYALLSFPCWKLETFRIILMEEDLGKYKERSNKLFVRNIS